MTLLKWIDGSCLEFQVHKQIWKSSNIYDDEKFLEVVIKVGAWDYGKMSFFVFVFVLIGLEGSFIHIYIYI